jgi:pullulanase
MGKMTLHKFSKSNEDQKGTIMTSKTKWTSLTSKLVASLLLLGALTYNGLAPASAKTTSTITIHYNRPDANYAGWNMWIWFPGISADVAATHGLPQSRNEFTGSDAYGKVLTLNLTDMAGINKIGFIVRKDDWTKDVGSDRFITQFDTNGNAEIWLRSNITKSYTGLPCLCAELYGATQDDYRTVNVTVSEAFNGILGDTGAQGWSLSDGINVVSAVSADPTKTIRTTKALTLTLDKDVTLGKSYSVSNSRSFNVTNKVLASNVATITTSAPTGVGVGETVRISGVDSTFDSVAKITSVSAPVGGPYTFSFAKTNANVPSASASGQVETGFGSAPIAIGKIFSSSKFADNFTYTGNDLGNTYTAAKTDFRVWAPTATAVSLLTFGKSLDASGNAVDPASIPDTGTETAMTQSVNGTWVTSVAGDQHGLIYQYRVSVNGEVHDTIDPYARAALANGKRGVVLDLGKTNPTGWNDVRPAFSGHATDASVYEIHVRDLSMDANSGIPAAHKGKYLAFTDLNTKYTTKVGKTSVTTKTGISAIKELGVTHVELQPVYDFTSVNETPAPDATPQFNWGYDPQNFNIPEGSYSTNANDPIARIKELKAAVQSMHNNGLRTIMDVVYPHVGSATDYSEQQIVPGYFYRTEPSGELANGSGCGNEIASERSMARKFIVDSVKYWTAEYHMDGYRFDQLGLMDVTTVQQIRTAIDSINPTVITYGEGWNMGDVLPADQMANQQNLAKIPSVGVFNDQVRDSVKGSTGSATGTGWISGASYVAQDVKVGITGNTAYSNTLYPNFKTANPGQSVNYVESHDNLTLFDKLQASVYGATNAKKAVMVRLAGAIDILAQGMPFQQAGQEFLRSKGGDANSYNSPDSVNSLKWAERLANADTAAYYAGLYAIRKAHPAFRMWTTDQLKSNLKFINTGDDAVIAYSLNGGAMSDTWKTIVVAHNSSAYKTQVSLPSTGTWKVYVSGKLVSSNTSKPLQTLKKAFNIDVPPMSTVVVAK